jgi:tetratricopeptide (TPR) repeat protein
VVADEAQRLQAMAGAPEAAQPALGGELRALALIHLGSTEVWTTRFEEAERHLDQGVGAARRIGRPFLEFTGLAYLAAAEIYRSAARAAERSRQAIELAERHGWTDEPAAGTAYITLASVLVGQERLEEAEPWAERAERTITAEAEPAARMVVHYIRGRLELARGRDADALAAFRAVEQLAGRLAAPNLLVARARAMLVYVLVRLGDTERAEQALAGFGELDRDRAETGIATAVLRLAQGDPQAAAAALAPVLDGSASVLPWARAQQLFEQTLPLYRQDNERPALSVTMNALVLVVLGYLAALRRDYGAASKLLDQGQALLRELRDDDLTGYDRLQQQLTPVYVDNFPGQIRLSQGDNDAAARLFTDGLAVARRAQDWSPLLIVLYDLALARQAQGDLASAAGHLQEGLALATQAGDETSAAYYLEALAAVAAQQDNPQRAVRLFAAARSILDARGSGWLHGFVPRVPDDDAVPAGLRSGMGDAAFEQAQAWGRSAGSKRAVEYALEQA